MIQITEKDDRLLLQFFDNGVKTDAQGMMTVSLSQVLIKEIDITAHIERAVENVLARRSAIDSPSQITPNQAGS